MISFLKQSLASVLVKNIAAKMMLMGILFSSATSQASVSLVPGSGPFEPLGSTIATSPNLPGTIIVDNLLPFQIHSSGGVPLYAGTLQARVVRSTATGTLHFYYKIHSKPNSPALPLAGVVVAIDTSSFGSLPVVEVDYRIDGIGTTRPVAVKRSVGAGDIVRFSFAGAGQQGIPTGTESRFFYVETRAQNMSNRGVTTIRLKSGEGTSLTTPMPN